MKTSEIECKELPYNISNEIKMWMHDMQSIGKPGTYYCDAGYLGTITIHINKENI